MAVENNAKSNQTASLRAAATAVSKAETSRPRGRGFSENWIHGGATLPVRKRLIAALRLAHRVSGLKNKRLGLGLGLGLERLGGGMRLSRWALALGAVVSISAGAPAANAQINFGPPNTVSVGVLAPGGTVTNSPICFNSGVLGTSSLADFCQSGEGATQGGIVYYAPNGGWGSYVTATDPNTLRLGAGGGDLITLTPRQITMDGPVSMYDFGITNLKSGLVSPTSTDAVNGSQLFGPANALGGGSGYDQNYNNYTPPTYTIGGQQYNDVGSTFAALNSGLTQYTIGPVQASVTPGMLVLVAPGGTGGSPGAPQVLGNVAAGVLSSTSNQAVNGSQLNATNNTVSTLDTQVNNLTNDLNHGATGPIQQSTTPDTLTLVAPGGTAANPGAPQTLTNVGPGALNPNSTDAVNGSQLYTTGTSTAAALGGGATFNPATGAITAPSYTIDGQTYNNVGGALGAVNSDLTNLTNDVNNGGGMKYFHANSSLPDSQATGTNSVAVGPAATASAANAVAIGNGASATNGGSVALGAGSTAGQADGGWAGTTIFGQKMTNNLNATAVVGVGGRQITDVADGAVNATSTDAVNGSQLYEVASLAETGQSALVSSNSANPQAASAQGPNSLAIGPGAKTTGDNSVAIGPDSTDGGRNNVFSVGSSTQPRQVINVAPGTRPTDATNLGQLAPIVAALGGGSAINPTTGAVTGPTYNIYGNDYNNVGSALGAMQQDGVHYDMANGAPTNSVTLSAGNGKPVALHNVAPGVAPTDAVNMSQLNSAFSGLNGNLNNLANQVEQNQWEARGGIASTAAMANLVFTNTPGKFSASAAVGGFEGASAFAGGLRYNLPDDAWRVQASVSYSPEAKGVAWGAGVGYEF
jgi:trimeric autotransporter adhesin